MAGLMLCSVVAGKANAAADFAYGLGYTAEHSDNITRVAANGKEDWIHGLIAGFGYRDNDPELATYFIGQVERRRYQKGTFDDETLYFIDASALWTISPQRFTWTVNDYHTQAVRDARAADTPNNRVGTNVFETGPDGYLHFGAGNTLDVGARYGNIYFGDSSASNNRLKGYGRWLYELNATSTVSFNDERLKVAFNNDDANIDYTRSDEFVRLEMRPEPSHFVLDVGHTKIDRERGLDLDGPLVRLSWLYRITSESVFGVTLAKEHDDAGTALLAGVTSPTAGPVPVAPVAEAVATADVYYIRRAEAFYTFTSGDWVTLLNGYKREFDYQLSPQDREERGGHAEVTYNASGLLATTVFGEVLRTTYLDNPREDVDKTTGVRWRYRAGRTLSFGLEGTKTWRSSTDPRLGYVDRRIFLGVYYSSGPTYSPARR